MKNYIAFSMLSLLIGCFTIPILAQRSVKTKPVVKKMVIWPSDSIMVSKAQNGDADAQAYLGQCFFWGANGAKEDNREAYTWIKKSAEKKSPYGVYYMGLCYLNGVCVPKNESIAETYFKKSFDLLNSAERALDAKALYFIGQCYEFGNGIKENEQMAKKYYNTAADLGNADAQYRFASYYNYLDFGKIELYWEYCEKAAQQGHIEALRSLALSYLNGDKGREKSYSKAIDYFQRAASAGDAESMAHLGNCYEKGEGVTENLQIAIDYYKKAEKYDNYSALYSLGCLYRDGCGVKRNYDLAVRYFRRADKVADYDDNYAKDELNEMLKKGRNYYAKQPIGKTIDIYELKPDDPFAKLDFGGNWFELSEDMKMLNRKEFKREKIKEWGIDRATKVAQHLVEIGFTSEQIIISQGEFYEKSFVNTPYGRVTILTYPHCTYYLIKDQLYGMVWSNGVQAGDLKVIKSCNGNINVTRGNR